MRIKRDIFFLPRTPLPFLSRFPSAFLTSPLFSQQNIREFEFIPNLRPEFKEGSIKKTDFNDKLMLKGEHLSCVPCERPLAQLSQRKICSWNISSYKNGWLSHLLSKIHFLVIFIWLWEPVLRHFSSYLCVRTFSLVLSTQCFEKWESCCNERLAISRGVFIVSQW